jgi:hypothetical protein
VERRPMIDTIEAHGGSVLLVERRWTVRPIDEYAVDEVVAQETEGGCRRSRQLTSDIEERPRVDRERRARFEIRTWRRRRTRVTK